MLTDPTIPWSSIHATELVLPPGKDWKDAVPLDQRCAG
jgi:hypothetical protein